MGRRWVTREEIAEIVDARFDAVAVRAEEVLRDSDPDPDEVMDLVRKIRVLRWNALQIRETDALDVSLGRRSLAAQMDSAPDFVPPSWEDGWFLDGEGW